MAIPDFLRSRLHLLITKFLKKDLAIDLGTSNTLIWIKGQGIVVNEPSVLAVRSSSKEGQTVIAVGHEAKSMLGREPQNIVVARPIKKGVIGDFTMTAQMVKSLIDTALPKGMFKPQPRIIISVPGDSTQVERRAIREAALSSGSTEVYLIEEPIAAALGAGLPIADAKGSMVLNMGGGTTELAVISLGGVVYKPAFAWAVTILKKASSTTSAASTASWLASAAPSDSKLKRVTRCPMRRLSPSKSVDKNSLRACRAV